MSRAGAIDRRTFITAATLLPLTACVTPRSTGTRPLRVATFNIWHDQGDWPARRPLLIEALRDADADVIALQEVLEDADKRLPNQAQTIADALGGYAMRFCSTDPEGARRRYGNAILSRLPIVADAWKKLEPLDDHRTALRARVRHGAHEIDIVTTHLAWQPEAGAVRARQIADLLGWLPGDEAPLVLLGDFNAPLGDTGLAGLAARGLASALPAGAVASTMVASPDYPPQVIDHIFADRRFAAADARLIGERAVGGRHASDHFGVAALLSLRR